MPVIKVRENEPNAQIIHSQKACRYINEHNFDIVHNNVDISVGLKDLLKVMD